jgi:hypothetical protein
MTRPPATYTVLNPDIEPRRMARLLGLHDLEQGVVVCHPVPPQVRTDHLGRDVLYALGKRPSTRGWPRSPTAAERFSTIWLQAERITDVLLVRADLFAHTTLANLVELNRGAGARTWLVFDSANARHAAAGQLGSRPAARVRITPRADQPAAPPRARGTRWPMPSPWLARAAATRVFTVDQVNAIDARMHAAFNNTSSWLSTRRRLLPEATERFLEILTSDASQQYRRARVLGASSALLLHGLAPEIRDRPRRPGAIACDPTNEQAREIRRHSNPASAALKALALLTDIDAEMLAYLTLDQLIRMPRGILLGHHLLQGAGAAALRAHALHQSTRGQPATAPLFTRRQLAEHRDPSGQKKSRSRTPRRLEVRLAALAGSLDITFPQPQIDPDFGAPAEDTCHDAGLIVRLLRLTASRALPLARLQDHEREAARRLLAGHAARLHEGSLAATDHLRFSQFVADTPGYLADVRRGEW